MPAEPAIESPAAPEDVRTLWVEYDDHQERYKPWRTALREMARHEWSDWEKRFDTPASVLDTLKGMEREGGDARLWLASFLRDINMSSKERSAIELRHLTEALWLGVCYDQLNAPDLAMFEVTVGRICQLVEAHSTEEQGRPNWAGVRYFSSHMGRRGIVPSVLRQHAHRRAKEDYELELMRTKLAKSATGALADEEETGLPKAPKSRGDRRRDFEGRKKGPQPEPKGAAAPQA